DPRLDASDLRCVEPRSVPRGAGRVRGCCNGVRRDARLTHRVRVARAIPSLRGPAALLPFEPHVDLARPHGGFVIRESLALRRARRATDGAQTDQVVAEV